MRKLLKSKKALSPVVAAIILIAVTVAVSIAVAAWMGSLTMGFMETKEAKITAMTFGDVGTENITLAVTNPGTSKVNIATIKVNDEILTSSDILGGDTLPIEVVAGGTDTIVVAYDWTAGNKYTVSFYETDGTLIGSRQDTA